MMSELTWDSLIERFIASRTMAPRTMKQYRESFKVFLEFKAVSGPLELTQDDLRAYYLSLKAGPFREATIVNRMRGLIRVLRWAFNRDLLLVDPTHDFAIPKPRYRIPRLLTHSDVLLLIEATDNHLRAFCRLRDRALLELLYGTGLRMGEAGALLLSDLDLADRSLNVRKGKGRPRRAPFGERVAAALVAYLEIRSRVAQSGELALFVAQHGSRLCANSIGQIVGYYSRKTGIHARPHDFRRAFATHLLENGANIVEIKALLGHVDLSSTQVYVQIAPVELTRAYAQSHPRARRSR
jgi:site-specific recombinase XerD